MKQKTRILIYILIAAAVMIFGTIAILTNSKADKPVSAQEHIDLGNVYLIELSYDKAVLEFTEAIEIEPLNPNAYLGLAEAYAGMGDTDKAVEVLEEGYDKTGDERLKDMLEELLANGTAAVNTVTAATEDTTENYNDENKEEMETLYIPISLDASNTDDYMYGYALIPADNWFYQADYDSDYNMTFISLFTPKNGRREHLGIYISISHYNDTFDVFIDENDTKRYLRYLYPSPALSVWDKDGNLLQYTETEYDDNFKIVKRNYYNGDGYLKRYERYEYTPEGNISKCYNKYGESVEFLSYDCDYDSNKKIAKITHYSYYNGDVIPSCTVSYKYDSNQNLISITDKLDTSETINEYDLKGNLICSTHKSPDSNYEITYKYDSNNNVIDETYKSGDIFYESFFDSNGNEVRDITYDVDGSISHENQYKYDSHNNRIWSYWKYDSGSSETTYTYDADGNLIKGEYVYTHDDGDAHESTTTYSYVYDSDGRIIEKTSFDGDTKEIFHTTRYTYDSHGNLLKESEISSSGEEYKSVSYEYIKIELSKSFMNRHINK